MTKITCKCGYKWETKSKMDFVSCPKCLSKTKINKVENALIIGEELDMTTKTKLKFVAYDRTLKEYPLKGFNKWQSNQIIRALSKTENIPEEEISIQIE